MTTKTPEPDGDDGRDSLTGVPDPFEIPVVHLVDERDLTLCGARQVNRDGTQVRGFRVCPDCTRLNTRI